MKALIPVAFVAGAAALAHGGSPALAAAALACGFILALVALTK